jgi:lysozyme
MTTSQKGIDIIKSFEGCRLKAYQDSAGVWTIGYGTIMYPSGKRVKAGDRITKECAEEYLAYEIGLKARSVEVFTSDLHLSQNQFDALVSFAYNLGVGALQRSTLLKKVRAEKNDPAIRGEFMKWVRAGGKVLKGLQRRRQKEADLYFSA